MKRTIGLILTLILCLGVFCACTKDEPDTPDAYDYISYETPTGLQIAPVVDLQPQITAVKTDYDRVVKEIKILQGMGFTRVYFVLCNEDYPVFSNPIMAPMEGSEKYFTAESIQTLGDVNAAYAKACKELGMEAIAIYKPYEGGGTMTVPADVTLACSNYNEATIGGNRVFFESFIAEHPEMRLSRRAVENSDSPITAVELYFMLDAFNNFGGGGNLYEYGSIAYKQVAASFLMKRYSLWYSTDNGSYTQYTGEIEVEAEESTLQVTDANGFALFDAPSKVAKVRLTGLNLPQEVSYVAVTLEDATNLRTLPYSMISLYSGEKKLPTSVTRYVRVPADTSDGANHVWGNESEPAAGTAIKGIRVVNGKLSAMEYSGQLSTGAERFPYFGFEYGWYGVGHAGDGWCTSAVYGIARGKTRYVAGELCEGYDEVRSYWLSQVQKAIDAGFDGVDVRLSNHSCMVTDYANYGFNEPIVQKYRELYGVDISDPSVEITQDVSEKMMRIRGDFFLQFLEEASDLLHQNDKLLLVHLLSGELNPTFVGSESDVTHWTAPKIIVDWKKEIDLADEVTVKDHFVAKKKYDATVCLEAKEYAKQKGKKVWVHCYIQQDELLSEDYVHAVEKDSRADGLLLYEITFKNNYNLDLINQVKYILQKAEAAQVKH